MEITKRTESLLFNYETTYKTDFRHGELKPSVETTYREKKPRIRPKYVPLKDLHALTPWKDPSIPFDVYHRPKPIIQTHPNIIQKHHERPLDADRAEVQRTRPKVIMTPAVDLDSVKEPERQMFIDQLYVSENEKALREAVTRRQSGVRAPLSEVYAPSNPLAMESLLEPYVSPEWRIDSFSWDRKQLRTYTEPTKTFWLTRPDPHCAVCENTAIKDATKKRKRH